MVVFQECDDVKRKHMNVDGTWFDSSFLFGDIDDDVSINNNDDVTPLNDDGMDEIGMLKNEPKVENSSAKSK